MLARSWWRANAQRTWIKRVVKSLKLRNHQQENNGRVMLTRSLVLGALGFEAFGFWWGAGMLRWREYLLSRNQWSLMQGCWGYTFAGLEGAFGAGIPQTEVLRTSERTFFAYLFFHPSRHIHNPFGRCCTVKPHLSIHTSEKNSDNTYILPDIPQLQYPIISAAR